MDPNGARRDQCRTWNPSVFLAVVALLLGGCQNSPASSSVEPGREDGIFVVATMSVFADFAEQIGGGHISVTSIVPVGGDPHTYEPTPSDAILLSSADVVLDNGLGLSPWFEPLKTNITGELVVLTDDIASEARAAEDRLDPHLWMVPDFVAGGYVTAIEQALRDADPANAEAYAANADRYRAEVRDLDGDIAASIESIAPENRKIVTSHDAFSYFAERYGLDVVGTITGVSTEEEPSARTVSNLIDRIREQQAPAVFFETTINRSLAERVALDAGVILGEPLYGDSVGEPGSGASDYIGMMRANTRSIVTALGGEG